MGETQKNAAVDVVIVGAGPVGLTIANILGLQGVRTLIVEERATLIDYPRGVGLDDEALRTFQSIGLVDRVLPHTVPNQILRFFDAQRRVLAEMAPPDACFGWPKRNGFVQPLVDAELLSGPHRQCGRGQVLDADAERAKQRHSGVRSSKKRLDQFQIAHRHRIQHQAILALIKSDSVYVIERAALGRANVIKDCAGGVSVRRPGGCTIGTCKGIPVQ